MSAPWTPPPPPGDAAGPTAPDAPAAPEAPGAADAPAAPAPLWPTAPPAPGPVDEPVAGSWAAPSTDPSPAAHRGGYLDQTYPAAGFGVQAEEPPAPWQQGPAPFPGAPGPFPGSPGPYPGAPAAQQTGPYPGAPGSYPGVPGAYPGAYPPAAGYPQAAHPQQPAHPGGQYAGPVPYGAPAYGWTAPPPPQDGLSIASLLVGVIGLLSCVGVFVGPVALGLGIAGLRRIKVRGTRGRGLAITGIVTGAIGTLVALLVVLSIASDPQGFLR